MPSRTYVGGHGAVDGTFILPRRQIRSHCNAPPRRPYGHAWTPLGAPAVCHRVTAVGGKSARADRDPNGVPSSVRDVSSPRTLNPHQPNSDERVARGCHECSRKTNLSPSGTWSGHFGAPVAVQSIDCSSSDRLATILSESLIPRTPALLLQ